MELNICRCINCSGNTENNPVAGLGMGSAIWYGVSSLLALFAGGWIAGRLAPVRRVFDGILHGLLTWSLITLVTLYFVTTTLGSILGGVSRMVGNTLGVVGNVAVAGKPIGNAPDNVAASAKQAYSDATAQWEKNKQENEAKAREVADQTAKAASTAAILTFVSLALGAVVAGYGAKRGLLSKENSSSVNPAAFAR